MLKTKAQNVIGVLTSAAADLLKTEKRKYLCFYFVSVLLFTASFWYLPSSVLSESTNQNFDWWSESIIYADIMYHTDFPSESAALPQTLNLPRLIEHYGVMHNYEDYVKIAYETGNVTFEKRDYEAYTSNVVIQRFFFRLLDHVLPCSNTTKIALYRFLNCLLLAFMISVIPYWIMKKTGSFKTGMVMLVPFVLFAPNLIMYGKNLYWCAWTLLMPTVVMMLLTESNYFARSNYKLLLLSAAACLTVFVKCLFYFEFITSVMISMMIPVIYYLLNLDGGKETVKKKLTWFFTISAFAVVGFLLVILIKNALVSHYYAHTPGVNNADGILVENLKNRLFGNPQADDPGIAESAKASLLYVLGIMAKKPFVSIKNIFSLTHMGLILLTAAASVAVVFLDRMTNGKVSNKIRYWLICCWISMAAPLSWFILAKPHTYIHNEHCSFTWFLLFDFMALSVIALPFGQIISLIRQNHASLLSLPSVNKPSSDHDDHP